MGATHDVGVTPRPIYKADGRKLPDCYTVPPGLRDELTRTARCISAVSVLGARNLDRIEPLDRGRDQARSGEPPADA